MTRVWLGGWRGRVRETPKRTRYNGQMVAASRTHSSFNETPAPAGVASVDVCKDLESSGNDPCHTLRSARSQSLRPGHPPGFTESPPQPRAAKTTPDPFFPFSSTRKIIMGAINHDKLSDHALDVLKDAGWTEARVVDNTPVYKAMSDSGIHLNDSGMQFCDELGGIVARHYFDSEVYELFHINLDQTFKSIVQEWLLWYEKQCGELLMPIGQSHQKHMLLMMDEEGKVWGGFDDHFEMIASTPEQAINRLAEYEWTEPPKNSADEE